jgi:hypothetical protein
MTEGTYLMSTRYPTPQTMAELANNLHRVVTDLRSLRVDLWGAASPSEQLVAGALRYAGDERATPAGETARTATLAAAEAVQTAEAELRRVGAQVRGAVQAASEAEAKAKAAKAVGARLRG